MLSDRIDPAVDAEPSGYLRVVKINFSVTEPFNPPELRLLPALLFWRRLAQLAVPA